MPQVDPELFDRGQFQAELALKASPIAAFKKVIRQAREVLEIVDGTDADPRKVVDDRGMRQSTDTEALMATVDEVLRRCSDQVTQYENGNRKVVGFLVGQCMKASHGTGNPKLFSKLLVQRLNAT